MRTTLGRSAVALTAVAALALGACGGDDATDTDTDTTTATDAGDTGTDADTDTDTEAAGGEAPGFEGSVSFAAPEDGAEVTSPVQVEMEAEGTPVEPAGEDAEGGHFHIMIDTDCVEPGTVIPSDDSHVHFGDGSTSAEVELEPGEHTLCLQLADGEHVASSLTSTISVTVTE